MGLRNTDDFEKIRSFSGVKPVIDGVFTAIRVTFTSLTLLTAMVVTVVAMFVWVHLARVPNLSMLEDYNPGASIQLFDRNDKLICTYPSKKKRQPISLAAVSPYMVDAVLAAEDHSFYEHQGISFVGILRAAMANLTAGKAVQGGSTLTQQLVKNLFFQDDQRTIPLKVAEGIVASEIEKKYSKEKILEIYLNQIYFGSGAWGIEQAARIYFDKSADQLNVAESAYLAGIIKSPSYLGDIKHRDKAITRQRTVIEKMEEYKLISTLEAREALSETLIFKRGKTGSASSTTSGEEEQSVFVPPYPYFCQYIVESLEGTYNYNHNAGLKVYTTLDTSAQKSAEAVMQASARGLPRGLDQAALVAINLADGSVLAMVGGLGDYLEHQWNSAVHPHTMGSSFKPFVYLSAFEHGVISPSSQLYDSPLSVLDEDAAKRNGGNATIWQPQNFDHKFLGYLSAEDALAHSRNVCSVRVAQQVGINTIIDTARRAGIKEELTPTLALSLGASAASPLSIANAYATIARGGQYMEPHFIRRVEDDRGKVLETFEPIQSRSLDLDATRQLVDILRKVVESGTGTRARIPGIQVAGKTGTADEARDLWFVGFTPDLVTAVWVGNAENKAVGGSHTTGGTVVAPIWKRFVSAYYKNHSRPRGELISAGGPNPESSIKAENEVKPGSQEATAAQSYQHSVGPRQARSRRSKKAPQNHGGARHTGTGIQEYNWDKR